MLYPLINKYISTYILYNNQFVKLKYFFKIFYNKILKAGNHTLILDIDNKIP